MKKISSFQLFSLLFITRAFLSVTYDARQNNLSVPLSMLSILVAIALECVLILPALNLAKIYPDRNILSHSYQLSRLFGKFVSVIYALFFIYETSRQLGFFSYFLNLQFFEFIPPWVIIIILGAGSMYGASCKINGIARACCVCMVVFFAMFFIIILGVTGKGDIYNIQSATPYPNNLPKAFVTDVFNKIGRSDELVILPLCLKNAKNNSSKAVYGYMFTKLLVMESLVFYSALILGNYASVLNLPFYTISTYAKTSIIERYDSVYSMVWTISTVMKNAVMIYYASVCLRNLFPKKAKISLGLSGIIPIIFPCVLSLTYNFDSIFLRSPSSFATIFLCTIIPLFVLIVKKRSEKPRKKS